MDYKVSTVIVSHNSENVLSRCVDSLQRQSSRSQQIFIVDSGSSDRNYLGKYQNIENLIVIEEKNIGFSNANNRGYLQRKRTSDFVLFLNPDAYLSPQFIEKAATFMLKNPDVGIVSGKVLWFDSEGAGPTCVFDSAGIFRTWYGRWYDRGQGQSDRGQFDAAESVPALCGAVMFCRCSALMDCNPEIAFDPDFFLYKEDIELSLRLRKRGWILKYLPDLIAYHSRGWKRKRSAAPLALRRIAAESEVLLYKKHPSPYMLWALSKYLLVRVLGI